VSVRHKLRDLAVYAAIAIGIVALILVCAILIPDRDSTSRTWYMFFVSTGFLCFFVTKMYWNHRSSKRIWILLVVLLLIHTVVFKIVLNRVSQFPDFLFLFTVPLEIVMAGAIVKVCLDVMPQKVKL
jgi:hypothetical protein